MPGLSSMAGLWGHGMAQPLWKTVQQFLIRLNIHLAYSQPFYA